MSAPIALQLYTIRETLADNFVNGVTKVANIGYAGVETAGFPGTTPAEAKALFDDLGLTVAGAHLPLPLGDRQNEVLDIAAALDCSRIICPALRPNEYYSSLDQIKQTAGMINEAGAVAGENGLSLGMHNHWWEYEAVEGRLPNELLAELLDETVFFEVDTYWAKVAGSDPVAIVKSLGSRAPLLHIKDGPAVQGEPMVAAGDGVMDISAIIEAGQGHTKWLIVELDACATDMMTAVEKSCRYLISNGLAKGK